jgi:hypothetical protein
MLARTMPYPHGEGRLLEVYGRLHLDRSEPTAARERLEAVLAVLCRRSKCTVRRALNTAVCMLPEPVAACRASSASFAGASLSPQKPAPTQLRRGIRSLTTTGCLCPCASLVR